MTNYKTCLKLTNTQAAYMAGLIDGEGTITLTRKHKNENRHLAVTISSTEKPLLDFVLKKAGIGKITHKRVSHARHTPSYVYAVYNRQALSIIEQIFPYLLSYKRYRAELVLNEYLHVTPRNGKYNAALQIEKTCFEKRFFALKATTQNDRNINLNH